MTRPLTPTCIVLLLPILLVALPAAAQDASSSFADQFFISRKTNPGGEKTVELLGSVIIWFLLLLSVLSIGLIGNLALTNQRKSILPQTVVDEVRRLLSAGDYRRVLDLTEREPSFFGQVLRAALGEASHGFGAVLRSLEQTSDELATQRLRRIEYLNVLGQVSPMIGLFGTVYGMILAFQSIVVAGGNADPVLLAGGISTALTTTFWGLVVAIPALAGYGIIRNKIDELTTEATLTAQELVNQFRPRARTRPQVSAKDADETPASDDTT
ncbi:MAG: MotA/TolQ/ExbB proton channel family protein [Planctomycetota bacterium]|jgi:biopolymer transport protein ExbB